MKIFGSDGFRCEFGQKFLTENMIENFGHALGIFYAKNKMDLPIIIGRDTRESGVIIENLVSAILLQRGISVKVTSVVPTPCISKLLQSKKYALGIMITASHNPPEDNGIKLFGHDGFKLKKKHEIDIENIMNSNVKFEINDIRKIGFKEINNDSFNDYALPLISGFDIKIPDTRILIDCANGAYSEIIDKVFSNHKNIYLCSNAPNGKNINLKCGALESKRLLKLVRQSNLDYGIAYDGDGDRAIFVSNEYGIIEIEKLAFLFYKMLAKKNSSVVSSKICNLALSHNLENAGAKLIETEVGDRFVMETVNHHQALFGFEPSGHFYFPDKNRSMDGLAATMTFFNLLNFYGGSIVDQLSSALHYERVTENILIADNIKLDLSLLNSELANHHCSEIEKLIIRRSMWDPVIRVYYDYVEKNNFDLIYSKILKIINELKI